MADRTKGGLLAGPLSRSSTDRTPVSADMMQHAVDILLKPAPDDESGQDLLEYALLVALIVLVTVGAVTTVGTTIQTVFWTYISGVVSGI